MIRQKSFRCCSTNWPGIRYSARYGAEEFAARTCVGMTLSVFELSVHSTGETQKYAIRMVLPTAFAAAAVLWIALRHDLGKHIHPMRYFTLVCYAVAALSLFVARQSGKAGYGDDLIKGMGVTAAVAGCFLFAASMVRRKRPPHSTM